jgi:hypothetical protein
MRPLAAAVAAFAGVLANPNQNEDQMQRTYHVEIEGIAPLIQNNPASHLAKAPNQPGKRGGSRKEMSEDWRVRVYLSADGKTLQHPSEALESCLKESAKEFKAGGRRTMLTPVKRTCFINGDFINITNRTEPDRIRQMNPRNTAGQLVPYYAPEFSAGWRMEFYLVLTNDDIVEPGHLHEILTFAGQRIGIGVHRPKFGRFIVVKFDETHDESLAA